MALERILVGDDRIDFARENFPYIPNSEVDFVDNSREVIERARTGNYSVIVTDLEYTKGGREGFEVLEALKENPARKILWTGAAHLPEVQEKARELGAELLSKEQIGSLVGQVASQAPLKKDGKILIYCTDKPDTPLYESLEKVAGLIIPESEFAMSTDLRADLMSGQYGLVIDTSPMMSALHGGKKSMNGTVAHDIKYMKLREVPRVACINSIGTAFTEMYDLIQDYFILTGKAKAGGKQ